MTPVVLVDWLGRGGIAQTSQEWVNAARAGGSEIAVVARAERELVGLSPPEMGGRIRTYRAVARFAAAQIRERRPTVVVVQNYVIPALEQPVYAAANEVGARVVVVVHDHRLHSLAAGNRLGLRRVLRRADTVLAHSRYVADAVAAWTRRDVGRLPLPVMSVLVDAPPVPSPFAVDAGLLALHFGVLKRGYKGTGTVVDVAARRPPGWRFGLLGVGSPARAVNAEILGGYAPTDVLAAALRQSAAVLLPYRIATQSGAVVAAQALGAVAVASGVGGIPEQIEDGVTGLLLPREASVERWAEALESLRDDGLRHGIAAKAQAHAQADHAAFVARVQAAIEGRMTNQPRVSVVMTIRAESPARVERALASVMAQDYAGPIEIVVAAPPGEPAPAHGSVVANPTGKRSPGLNRAVAAATGDIVVRVDARSTLPPDYVRRCVARLQRDPSVGVVGGVQLAAVPASSGVVARGIARALRNRWTTGGASYRRTGASGPVDTVYLGVFRRDELLAVGGYDESLDANEDFDLCQRYAARGQQVWLEDGLAVDYEGRTRLADVWRQYVAFGEAKVRYWRMRHERPNGRQLVGLLGPAVGFIALVAAVLAGRGVVAIAGGIAGVAALDQVAVGGRPSVGERAVSIVGSIVVPIAWAVGAYREFVRR